MGYLELWVAEDLALELRTQGFAFKEAKKKKKKKKNANLRFLEPCDFSLQGNILLYT